MLLLFANDICTAFLIECWAGTSKNNTACVVCECACLVFRDFFLHFSVWSTELLYLGLIVVLWDRFYTTLLLNLILIKVVSFVH